MSAPDASPNSSTPAPPVATRTDKGVRGHELDLHVTFAQALPREQALAALLALEGMTVELYAPHDQPEAPVPSARLTGPLRDAEATRTALTGLLAADARVIEVGMHGFLRSVTGQTEWMPWRKNAVLPRNRVDGVTFDEGVKFILE
jgi:hypothetical protein